jgi:excinuclease ABC subunit C
MENKMSSLSENLDFEGAAKYRDYISAVNYLINKVKVVEYAKDNKNIVLLESLSDDSIKFFLIKGNKILFSEKYILNDFEIEQLKLMFKNNILSCFDNKAQTDTLEIGKEEIDDAQIIYTYLKNSSNNCRHIIIPNKWLKNRNFIDNAINKLLV